MLEMAQVKKLVSNGGRVLDPGCGEGAFLEPVLEAYCQEAARRGRDVDWLVDHVRGVELDPTAAKRARASATVVLHRYGYEVTDSDLRRMCVHTDFLESEARGWDLIIGNPPYVRLEGIPSPLRVSYRARFSTATNRFDLYFLFFEQALRLLRQGGRLCFVTPQKYMQVASGAALRGLLASRTLEEIRILDEGSFEALVTYPAITQLTNSSRPKGHRLVVRNERMGFVRKMPQDGFAREPWAQVFTTGSSDVLPESGATLRDICTRIGVGIATGADEVFVLEKHEARSIPDHLLVPSVSGRDLSSTLGKDVMTDHVMLFPYDSQGKLLRESELGSALHYFHQAPIEAMLRNRTCVRSSRKPWYAFHETPRPRELAQPKILVQDVQKAPRFHLDTRGLVPRHSVYYIVPQPGVDIRELLGYLNSVEARQWLVGHAQHAANGHFRIQTLTLRRLPVPLRLLPPKHVRAGS
jgi:tRNA1(Val) A37 N6-methylase TrmN6